MPIDNYGNEIGNINSTSTLERFVRETYYGANFNYANEQAGQVKYFMSGFIYDLIPPSLIQLFIDWFLINKSIFFGFINLIISLIGWFINFIFLQLITLLISIFGLVGITLFTRFDDILGNTAVSFFTVLYFFLKSQIIFLINVGTEIFEGCLKFCFGWLIDNDSIFIFPYSLPGSKFTALSQLNSMVLSPQIYGIIRLHEIVFACIVGIGLVVTYMLGRCINNYSYFDYKHRVDGLFPKSFLVLTKQGIGPNLNYLSSLYKSIPNPKVSGLFVLNLFIGRLYGWINLFMVHFWSAFNKNFKNYLINFLFVYGLVFRSKILFYLSNILYYKTSRACNDATASADYLRNVVLVFWNYYKIDESRSVYILWADRLNRFNYVYNFYVILYKLILRRPKRYLFKIPRIYRLITAIIGLFFIIIIYNLNLKIVKIFSIFNVIFGFIWSMVKNFYKWYWGKWITMPVEKIAHGWQLRWVNLKKVRFYYRYGRRFTHWTVLEIIWTIAPSFLLLAIGIPSLALLYVMEEVHEDFVLTIKVIGHQWYWTYSYVDDLLIDSSKILSELKREENELAQSSLLFNQVSSEFCDSLSNTNTIPASIDHQPTNKNISYSSYMLPTDSVTGYPRLLGTDNPVVIPELTNIRWVITSADVLHSFAIPSLGFKMDAVPGRLNVGYLYALETGVFFGQCSELCGINHGFMPIHVEVLPCDLFGAFYLKLIGSGPVFH